MRWFNTTKWIFVTEDDELALMLTPEWLPGQRKRINQYKATERLTVELLNAIMKGY